MATQILSDALINFILFHNIQIFTLVVQIHQVRITLYSKLPKLGTHLRVWPEFT